MSYQGKFSGAPRRSKNRKAPGAKLLPLLLALVLLTGAVTGTLAWLAANTGAVTNTFTPGKVPNTPVEEFDGQTKESIVVKNTGNIDAYVRVKLVTYRVDEDGNHIGGVATIPEFTPESTWFKQGDYYYYKLPVAPDAVSDNLLKTPITLQKYEDADGGKQVIEVISESIQSQPASTVAEAWWDVTVNGYWLVGTFERWR